MTDHHRNVDDWLDFEGTYIAASSLGARDTTLVAAAGIGAGGVVVNRRTAWQQGVGQVRAAIILQGAKPGVVHGGGDAAAVFDHVEEEI